MIDRVRLLAMARKETLQLRRDRKSLALAFGLPVLLLLILGYAITWDVENIKTAVLDLDNSARSRELMAMFTSSKYFSSAYRLSDEAEIASLLERGKVSLVLVVPSGFAADLDAGRTAPVQAIVDGGDANTATITLGYAQGVIEHFSSQVRLSTRQFVMPLTVQSRVWYNEELKSRHMIVPGLVAVIMMIIAAILTSLTVAREWERGTMEQLAATPISRAEIILGKLLPYVVISFVDIAVVSIVGVTLFGAPFRGNVLLLAVLSCLFVVGALSVGISISVVARSQALATQIGMVTTFLPAMLLSGFMFAIEVMPPILRAITYVVPARYFLVVTRGIFLKGVGLDVLYTQGVIMLVFAFLGLSLAICAFKKELR